jgi:hypothetical protein
VPYENQLIPEERRKNFSNGPPHASTAATRNGHSKPGKATCGMLARALSTIPSDRFPSVTSFAQAFRSSLDTPPDVPETLRVFLSYRRQASSGWAAFFADKLAQRHGFDVFVDRQRADKGGEHVPDKIRKAIQKCDYFVCLVGPQTLRSGWVLEEISIAYSAGKPMIPIIEKGFRSLRLLFASLDLSHVRR